MEVAFHASKEKVAQVADDAPIFHNLPPTAGAIYWARSMHKRISDPMAKLILYNELSGEELSPGSGVALCHLVLCAKRHKTNDQIKYHK